MAARLWIPIAVCFLLLSPACSSDVDGDAAVVVERQFPDGDPIWFEGSIGFVRLTPASGEVLVEDFDHPDSPGSLRVDLPAGELHVESFQRPCEGTCEELGPPTPSCEIDVELERRRTLELVVLVGEDGCEIRTDQ